MIPSIWQWLTAPGNWSGSGGIADRLLEHLTISAIVLVVAALIAIPLGLWIGHSGRGRSLVTVANAARAVPTLGLLFALALWLGPKLSGDLAFSLPSIIVLVLLAVPPMLAGTYAGVEAVDPAARDAARGMGMRPGQVLRQVEFPCALPLLLSGVRAATLQVIATATIAAYVGMGGLGRFLIDGLATADYPETAGGALLVSLLALLIDLLLAAATRLVVSPGLDGRADAARSRGRIGSRGKFGRAPRVDAASDPLTTAS